MNNLKMLSSIIIVPGKNYIARFVMFEILMLIMLIVLSNKQGTGMHILTRICVSNA